MSSLAFGLLAAMLGAFRAFLPAPCHWCHTSAMASHDHCSGHGSVSLQIFIAQAMGVCPSRSSIHSPADDRQRQLRQLVHAALHGAAHDSHGFDYFDLIIQIQYTFVLKLRRRKRRIFITSLQPARAHMNMTTVSSLIIITLRSGLNTCEH